ncbi:unnamed protein product [Staurois parvus]|uniref:Uncharacterized protein n=1 Tax=Staurois parvus TaxID=386267 RepID=A0ABN9CWY7_9NEOB|nr:unnamed protein product [Staurois parvus]
MYYLKKKVQKKIQIKKNRYLASRQGRTDHLETLALPGVKGPMRCP